MKKLIKKSSFLRLFTFMKKNLPVYIISLLVLSFLSMIVQIVLATMFRDMFDAISVEDFSGMLNTVKKYGLISLVIFAVQPLFNYIIQASAARATGNIRKSVFQHICQLPLSYFEAGHSGNLISRMTNDIAETKKAYSELFIRFAIQIITGIGTTIYMFALEWRLALVAVGGGLITALVNTYYARILKRISSEVQEKLANLTEELSNILAGIKVIKTFNLYQKIMDKFINKNQEVYQKSYDRVNKKAVINGFNTLGGMFSFVGLTVLGAFLAIRGEITFGVIVAVVQLQNGVSMLVRTLGNMISEIQSSLAAADRLYEVLDQEVEQDSYEVGEQSLVTNLSDLEAVSRNKKREEKKAIVVDQLFFNYKKEKKVEDYILDNLSFTVPEGSIVALAGPSGGGKSTIFKLLLNFYPPDRGDIIIDGRSISEQSINKIRDKIAYVPQDAYLFAGTIRENIAYGKRDASKEEIIKAAKVANAHHFIVEMEEGYKTMVGERGAQLSGGQRQRISIARAVLKDADILLLDEATSALDTESEKLVQDALNNLMEGRTTLVIAHRLTTIKDADKILVLDEGRIVEKGSHQELLQKEDGIYQKLYYQQFENEQSSVIEL